MSLFPKEDIIEEDDLAVTPLLVEIAQ